MSFGFGVGDIILVSRAFAKVYITVREAPAEQQSLVLELELLRAMVGGIANSTGQFQICADNTSSGSPTPIANCPGNQQLSRCLQLLNNLDEIAAIYMGTCPSERDLNRKKGSRSRRIRWGLYKKNEFVQLLGDLRNLTILLTSYASIKQIETEAPLASAVGFVNWQTPIQLIDALDRPLVFPFERCDTWEVCNFSDRSCNGADFMRFFQGFEDFLKYSFKESAGKDWVEAGRYEIVDESGGGCLDVEGMEEEYQARHEIVYGYGTSKEGLRNSRTQLSLLRPGIPRCQNQGSRACPMV